MHCPASARCHAAGMNDHIAKPIEMGRLYQVLRRWCRSERTTEPPSAAGTPSHARSSGRSVPTASAEAPGGIDGAALPDIDVEAGRGRVGGQAAHCRLLQRFARDHADHAGRIRSQLGDGDPAAARQEAHALAGVALNLGMEKLGRAARAVEQTIGAGSADPAAALAILEQAQTSALDAIERLCPVSDAQAPPPAANSSGEQLDAAMDLDTLLADRNLRARHAFDGLLTRVGDPALRRDLAGVGEQIERLDFDAARKSLAPVLERLRQAR